MTISKEEIVAIYTQYDIGHMDESDAREKIVTLLKIRNLPKIDEIYTSYDNGNIDSGESLMRVMNFIEKEIYQDLWD